MRRLILLFGILVAIAASSLLGLSSPASSGIFCVSAYAQEDDVLKMYEQYLTPQEQAVLDRFEEAQQRAEEAQEAERGKKRIALIVSLIVGLIPFCYLLVKSFRFNTWKDNPGGTVWGLVIGLAGGVLLFAINYGIFWLRFKYASQFSAVVTYALVGGLIIGVIYLLNKKG